MTYSIKKASNMMNIESFTLKYDESIVFLLKQK